VNPSWSQLKTTLGSSDRYGRYVGMYIYICSADGSTHTESNKLYRRVKHRYRPNLSPRQRPTAKARDDQAALAVSAEARGATHRARPRSIYMYRSRCRQSVCIYVLLFLLRLFEWFPPSSRQSSRLGLYKILFHF